MLFVRPLIVLLLLTFTGEALAKSLSGAYLAARQAAQRNDLTAASTYYVRALALDPQNPRLQEAALRYTAMTGDFNRALPIARRIEAAGGRNLLVANLLLMADIEGGDFASARTRVEAENPGFTPLLKGLLGGWIAEAEGDVARAEAQFNGLSGNDAFGAFGQFHLGLARAARGDHAAARDAYAKAEEAAGRPNPRIARAYGLTMEALGDAAAATKIYREAHAVGYGVSLLGQELSRLETAGAPTQLDLTPAEGVAEALYGLATALGRDTDNAAALIYAQLAARLDADFAEAQLLVGELLDDRDQHQLAAKAFEAVDVDSPLFLSAEIGRADALRQMGDSEASVATLRALSRAQPDEMRAHVALGDALRRTESFADAAVAYSAAIDLLPEVQDRHWALFYERGVSFERSKQWDKAEVDFLRALELNPDQPLVLNYLGYSWVELRRNLAEAQEMIEKAVAQEPDNGFITDSLGWVLYRTGQFEEAVPHLERAVELMPVDPIINDHLGDALWMVGRRLEAEFQWRRALSFEPTETDAERIRRKLEVGLDQVLAEEEQAAEEDKAEAKAEPNDG